MGVFCSPDREGRPEDPLKAGARERGVPVMPLCPFFAAYIRRHPAYRQERHR